MEIMIRKLKMEIEILKTKLSKAGLNTDISYKEMQEASSPTGVEASDYKQDDVDKKMEEDMQRASSIA